MEDAPELWGWRIWVVSEQTSPTCSYLPLTHVVPISTQRELLPHFPLTQSELSLHNLQAWTPSSLMFGGFIICYILVVLENGDWYWCWNQCWKDACLLEGDGTRQRRTVGCDMEVMVSPSFSSKYYQLVHINKFLLNEHQLPCLSFPASLMYIFTYCSCLRLCFPLSPLCPICLWHQDMASLPPHLQPSSCRAPPLENCECITPTYSNHDRDSQHGQDCPSAAGWPMPPACVKEPPRAAHALLHSWSQPLLGVLP